VLEEIAGALDAQRLDVRGRGLANLPVKGARERPLAHQRALGQHGYRELLVQVPGDPSLELTQLGPRRLLDRQGVAELGLATRSLEKHAQLAGGGGGDAGSEVLLDQREGEVDAGGDTRRGPDVAVVDEDRIRIYLDARKAAGEVIAVRPMGCRSAV